MSYEMSDAKQSPYADAKATSISPVNTSPTPHAAAEDPNRTWYQRYFDSFKPPAADPSKAYDGEMPKPAGELHRKLKGRHLQMIAIGGSIGTGLFVGSAGSFTAGGPAAVLIGFILVGAMLFCVVHALGELAVLFPIQGSFSIYSSRFIEPAWGFAMGWNYAMQWLIVLPLELSAAAIVINYWNTHVPLGVWITIFFLIIIAINLAGVRGYGEAEFLFSIIKVLAVVGFIILAIVIDVGGAPGAGYLGAKTYSNPGAFSNGFHGVCAVFVNAAFSFAGTELVGLAAAETANPRKTLPKAAKQVFWRILLFYVVSLLLIGFIVPYDNPDLTSDQRITASPFVIAIRIGGIKVLPDIFNAVILIAVLSVGNSSTYGSSRTLAGMARVGLAPKFLGYVDRQGRPLAALVVALLFGGLAYVNLAPNGGDVFNWLLAISALSSFFTWGSICFCHIRFRRAWIYQGHSLKEIPFRSHAGVIGSWFGLIMNILCLIAQFYVAIWPVGNDGKTGTAEDFFIAYVAVPVILVFYLIFKVINWKSSRFIRSSEMDLTSNRRSLDMAEIEAEEEAERLNPTPLYKKIWGIFC
ncbi:histidine permease [Savitreella phatthalungensis]